MRTINYPFNANKAFLKNSFSQILGELELKRGENELKTTSDGEYYEDSFLNKIFVYEGEGILDFSDCLKDLDFNNLEFSFLEEFLSTQEHNINISNFQKRKIEEFIKVYDTNIKKGCVYLAPSGFKELDRALVYGFMQ
ncbi:hypothetical protein B6S12_05050 [Helicobacter valdiviensis]|uniref:Uncharacterized protein n=1 Tax=Helicobacter valdiviensis TaxID=1458358 RepID=A0A2W6MW59_9HELI|nr:hypothetical protein [Helicobacter valdiviensis]PZT48189.1 hypothetical protein B6S12_05050 [Helicobacter valdiviensis]